MPSEFDIFMDNQVQEWLQLGVMKIWEEVRFESEPEIPTVVCPLGVEPKKTSSSMGWQICKRVL